jgi:hypothetical protein
MQIREWLSHGPLDSFWLPKAHESGGVTSGGGALGETGSLRVRLVEQGRADTFALELIDHRKDADGSSIREFVTYKIGQPAVIRPAHLGL